MLKKKGFTLIELLSVIVILAIIALIAVPTIINIITKVRISSAKANFHGYIDAVENASSLYDLNTGKKPTSIDELEVEAKNIDNINLISLTFNENGDVEKAKATINGLYCTYKESSDVKCTTNMYSYIKNIYNLTEYDKETIQNIYFTDEARNGTPIDISVDSDETVLLYLEENGNVINEKNMYDMYIYSESIISAPQVFSNFFRDLTNVITIDFNDMFDTSDVLYMGGVFRDCKSLKELDVSSFNTSNVRSMHQMFYNCSSITELDVSNFDTSKVSGNWVFPNMFFGMSSLKTLDLSSFDTSGITNMSQLFWDCTSLESVNLSSFDTSNVTDMNSMFFGCESLKKLDVSNFDTSKVTSMQQMFSRTHTLAELDLSSFNTSNVTNMSVMFQSMGSDATNVSLNLGENFNTSNVENMSYMFTQVGYNSDTVSINLGNKFDTSNVTDMTGMFWGTGAMWGKASEFVLDLGDKFTFNENVITTDFTRENGATKLIIPSTVTNIPDGTFKDMRRLKEIIFEHTLEDSITFPTAGSETGAFYYSSNINTTITTNNDLIKNYDWLTDNRTVTFN